MPLENSYKVYCDETWKDKSRDIVSPYYVFHGVLVKGENYKAILESILSFRRDRGLNEELKWTKVAAEFKNAGNRSNRSRYEEYLERIFFDNLGRKKISFGVMYLEKSEYHRVEKTFTLERACSKHEFFFMLYFQFLTHCFIKNQVKNQPVEIFIDGRNLGKQGSEYDLNKLRTTLNYKSETLQRWRSQPEFADQWLTKIRSAIQSVELLDSSGNHFIQLADVVAGCFRYVLENRIPPPMSQDQGTLFDINSPRRLVGGQDHLSNYFYSELRKLDGYKSFDLCSESRHFRFNIFPFRFV